jgi:malonyl-CoA decarboxylase
VVAVANRFERMVRLVRGWRGGADTAAVSVSDGLSDADVRRLRPLIDDCITGRGGEVAARRRATALGATFLELGPVGQRRFFELLATEYGPVPAAVDTTAAALTAAGDDAEARRRAESELRAALVPRREQLLRRFIGLEGGLPFLVDLREALLDVRGDDPALRALDGELRGLLDGWFDVALLRLERLTWESPAALLERLIEYEAVHAITSWDDLRGRMGPGRRCYAFCHPGMPHDPLIFVEVALTRGIATSLPPLLDHDRADRDRGEADADTAVFYSISNAHRGLAGVSLGDFLIKRVVEQLSAELPGLATFVTLSPIPGFRAWLEESLSADRATLAPGERAHLCPADPEAAEQQLVATLATDSWSGDAERSRHLRPVLERLCAHYLLRVRRGGRAADPVAHFHLSNGARVERINWAANPGPVGLGRSFGLMVNYRYAVDHIEANHDRYVEHGDIPASGEVRRLLEPMAPPRSKTADPGRSRGR